MKDSELMEVTRVIDLKDCEDGRPELFCCEICIWSMEYYDESELPKFCPECGEILIEA